TRERREGLEREELGEEYQVRATCTVEKPAYVPGKFLEVPDRPDLELTRRDRERASHPVFLGGSRSRRRCADKRRTSCVAARLQTRRAVRPKPILALRLFR